MSFTVSVIDNAGGEGPKCIFSPKVSIGFNSDKVMVVVEDG